MDCDSINIDAVRKIAEYGDVYIEEILHNHNNYASPDKIITDCCEGLNFFFGHCFYQGRSDVLARTVDLKAREVICEYTKEMNDLEAFSANLHHIKARFGERIGADKRKAGRERDYLMLIGKTEKKLGILNFISDIEKISYMNKGKNDTEKDKGILNIVEYSLAKIKENKVADIYKELDDIYSMGPKCSSFFLRDIVFLYYMDKEDQIEDKEYLQPIDRWVVRKADEVRIISIPQDTGEGRYIHKNYDCIREKIVKCCRKIKVSPTKFNAGAWYAGKNKIDYMNS